MAILLGKAIHEQDLDLPTLKKKTCDVLMRKAMKLHADTEVAELTCGCHTLTCSSRLAGIYWLASPSCQDKQAYVVDYMRHEGVQLDPAKIAPNPGRRTVAKLALNSFWGRWGMNLDKLQLEFVNSLEKFNTILTNRRNKMCGRCILSDRGNMCSSLEACKRIPGTRQAHKRVYCCIHYVPYPAEIIH
ncbi:hypothetical protein JTE90_003112 [Oedothorax gibbosus]|uniref:DNA-directed DNA polymerase n=1 Tax=Oedothorax gibbosus TaxID=931172 RepID=A0AAV6VDK1_9ARAC|nr:hypothetical protein JTE90_003112 [Oedothorax gibbosus]